MQLLFLFLIACFVYDIKTKSKNLKSHKIYKENNSQYFKKGKDEFGRNALYIYRDKFKSDYLGNVNETFSNDNFTPLIPKPLPEKHSVLDDLPIIYSSGPKKGQIMTEDDFPKPFGYKYSEYKRLHPVVDNSINHMDPQIRKMYYK